MVSNVRIIMMEPARNMSWENNACNSKGPKVGRLITWATIKLPEEELG